MTMAKKRMMQMRKKQSSTTTSGRVNQPSGTERWENGYCLSCMNSKDKTVWIIELDYSFLQKQNSFSDKAKVKSNQPERARWVAFFLHHHLDNTKKFSVQTGRSPVGRPFFNISQENLHVVYVTKGNQGGTLGYFSK